MNPDVFTGSKYNSLGNTKSRKDSRRSPKSLVVGAFRLGAATAFHAADAPEKEYIRQIALNWEDFSMENSSAKGSNSRYTLRPPPEVLRSSPSRHTLLCGAAHPSCAARRCGFRPRLLTSPFDGNVEALRKRGPFTACLTSHGLLRQSRGLPHARFVRLTAGNQESSSDLCITPVLRPHGLAVTPARRENPRGTRAGL